MGFGFKPFLTLQRYEFASVSPRLIELIKQIDAGQAYQSVQNANLLKLTSMHIEQIYTGCLAAAAYYIESNGEAAIIDPLRESAPYLERAARDGARIKYVLETHFHADFVSGHLDLAAKTGASIVFGPGASPSYPAHVATHLEELPLGNVRIRVLHTPGHTLESSCYLLIDEEGKEHALFTGDTLFLGDVGRPDLVQKVKAEITPEFLAGKLYDSLREQIMPLADSLIIYPGHGAGSACGKNMSCDRVDTLGNQKKTNYALREDMTREEFIKELVSGLTEPPAYFPSNVLMNLQGGISSVDALLRKGTKALSPVAFKVAWEAMDAIVIDTRHQDQFVEEHIPGSIFIGLHESFAPWVGTLIKPLSVPILFVAEEGKEQEVVTRLARVGYDNPIGFLSGGIAAWKSAGFDTDFINEIPADALEVIYNETIASQIIDVRREKEFSTVHLKDATNVPLDYINKLMQKLDAASTYYIYCAGGYRSVIFISILKARGFHHLINIQGGFKNIRSLSLPLEQEFA